MRNVALVFVGGMVGTLCRFGLAVLIPHVHGVPVGILVVNVVGAFLLGLLLGWLPLHPRDRSVRQEDLRLLLGTGLLGGFTTYSLLAADLAVLLQGEYVLAAFIYALLTLVIGGLAGLGGLRVGRRWRT